MQKLGISLAILAMSQLIVAGFGMLLRNLKMPIFSHELIIAMLWTTIITSIVAGSLLIIVKSRGQWKNDVF